MPDNGAQQVLKVRELAGELRIGLNQAYDLVRSGAIRSVTIGRTIRVTREAVEEFKAGGRRATGRQRRTPGPRARRRVHPDHRLTAKRAEVYSHATRPFRRATRPGGRRAVSWEAVKMVIRLSREPGRWTDAEFRLLINLADRLNQGTGQLNPSTPTIARDMGRAPAPARGTSDPAAAAVRRLLAQLQAKGELARGDGKGGQARGRRYKSQPYRLLLRGALSIPSGRTSGAPSGRTSENNKANLRGQTGRASGSPNLGSEPKKKPAAGAAPDGAGGQGVSVPTPIRAELERQGLLPRRSVP